MAGKKRSKTARSTRSAGSSKPVARSRQRTVKVTTPAAPAADPVTITLPQSDFSVLGLRPARATGRTGLAQYAGYIYEEFLTPLIGQRAYDTYKEMSYNDATVGAMLTATEQLIHNTSITFKAADESNLALKIRDLVQTSLFDMASSWRNVQSETMSFFPYGWSWQQVTYKKRTGYSRNPLKTSKHNDSLIGWADVMPHAQSGLVRWELDDKNRVLGIRHRAAPDHDEVLVPKSRSLHFRTKSTKWNPEGYSVLRNSYRSWLLKKRFEELEGIGIERDLTGLPILTPPEGLDLWNSKDEDAAAARTMAENIVRNVRVDKHMGLVLPFGWTFTLAASEGSRSFDIGDVISRYDQRIAGVMLADMILIGHERVGSFALIAAKMKLYSAALEGYDREISDVWNKKAIPDLVAINGFDPALAPEMKFGPIETPNLKELGAYVSSIKGGQVDLDRPLENHLRAVANFPPLQPGEPTTPDSPEAEDEVDEQRDGEGDEDQADAGVTPAMTGDIP